MFVVLAVVLLMPLVHDGSRVVLFGLDVCVWLVALGFYALGVLAGAAAVRSCTKWANRCVTLPPCVAANRVGISLRYLPAIARGESASRAQSVAAKVAAVASASCQWACQ